MPHFPLFRGGRKEVRPYDIRHNGICCTFFGAPEWFCNHTKAANFPFELDLAKPADRERSGHFTDWIWSNGRVLPCGKCRENYVRHVRALLHRFTHLIEGKCYFRCRRDCEDFFFALHNRVNQELGKKVWSKTELEGARQLYESGRAGYPIPARTFIEVRPLHCSKKFPNSVIIHNTCVAEI